LPVCFGFRIYQYVKLNYIKAATSASPVFEKPLTASSGDGNTLLNLDPSTVVFYVGGYPPDFRVQRVIQSFKEISMLIIMLLLQEKVGIASLS